MINDETPKIEAKSSPPEQPVAGMHKRRVAMADGKRYMIYYTFGEAEAPIKSEDDKNV
jgi:hypothetical protein